MSNSKPLLWGLLISWIAGSAYWHVCKIKNLCDADLITISGPTEVVLPPEMPLIIADTPALFLRAKGNFGFAKGGIVADKSTVYPEMDSLALYLEANKSRVLTITGFYSKQETNTTTFPDLGLARATEIKNWLRRKGLPDSMFTIKSRIDENLNFKKDSLIGGIAFSFPKKTVSTVSEFAESQKFESIFQPMDLYFPASGAAYVKTNDNQKYMAEAKKYLSQSGDKRLIIIGHTAGENSDAWNEVLSRKRADSLKIQFVTFGIPPDKIIALGKGKYEPRVTSATPLPKYPKHHVTVIVK